MDMEKYNKTIETKNYNMLYQRYVKDVDNGKFTPIQFFTKSIIPIGYEGFLRKINVLKCLAFTLLNKNVLTEDDVEFIHKLLNDKKDRTLKGSKIDLKKYMNDIILFKEQLFVDITREKTLAFITAPLLYNENFSNIAKLKYSDIVIHKVADSAIIIFTNHNNETTKVILDDCISEIYINVLDALKEKYGEDAHVFKKYKQITWEIAKASKILHANLESYISSNGEHVKETTFLSFFRNQLKIKGGNYFRSF